MGGKGRLMDRDVDGLGSGDSGFALFAGADGAFEFHGTAPPRSLPVLPSSCQWTPSDFRPRTVSWYLSIKPLGQS